jgi:hypothetical protein
MMQQCHCIYLFSNSLPCTALHRTWTDCVTSWLTVLTNWTQTDWLPTHSPASCFTELSSGKFMKLSSVHCFPELKWALARTWRLLLYACQPLGHILQVRGQPQFFVVNWAASQTIHTLQEMRIGWVLLSPLCSVPVVILIQLCYLWDQCSTFSVILFDRIEVKTLEI